MDRTDEDTSTWFYAEHVKPMPKFPRAEIIICDAHDGLRAANLFEVKAR
jgi:hypothetical protein